jgi:hypothetical protein
VQGSLPGPVGVVPCTLPARLDIAALSARRHQVMVPANRLRHAPCSAVAQQERCAGADSATDPVRTLGDHRLTDSASEAWCSRTQWSSVPMKCSWQRRHRVMNCSGCPVGHGAPKRCFPVAHGLSVKSCSNSSKLVLLCRCPVVAVCDALRAPRRVERRQVVLVAHHGNWARNDRTSSPGRMCSRSRTGSALYGSLARARSALRMTLLVILRGAAPPTSPRRRCSVRGPCGLLEWVWAAELGRERVTGEPSTCGDGD